MATSSLFGGQQVGSPDAVQTASSLPSDLTGSHTSESLLRLRALKESLLKELSDVEKEKVAALQEEPLVPLSLADEYRDSRSRRQGKSQGEGKPASPAPRLNAKQRDMDLLFETQEREKRALELHNLRLRNLIELRQQSSKRRELRAEAEIARLKAQLDSCILARSDTRATVAEMKEMNKQIQSRAAQLQSTIEHQAEIEKMNLIRQYRVRMHELKKDLASERQTNYNGAQEWIDKNNALRQELAQATDTLDRITTTNTRLAAENKELKQKFKEQEEERTAVVHEVTAVKRQNKRLEEQVRRLEEESIGLARSLRSPSSLSPQTSPPRPSTAQQPLPDYETKYLETISKVRRQLECERRTLKQVRTSHIELLQERTELEVFLRQCLLDVRKEITKASTTVGAGASLNADQQLQDYTSGDRKRLLDLYLSKERVLTTLYAKTFPFKVPQEALPCEVDALPVLTPRDGTEFTSSAELDMDNLWNKWKAWTERALPEKG